MPIEFRKVNPAIIENEERQEQEERSRRVGELRIRRAEEKKERTTLPIGTFAAWRIKTRIALVTESDENITHCSISNGDPFFFWDTSRLLQRIAEGEMEVENPFIVMEMLAAHFRRIGNNELADTMHALVREHKP